MLALIWAQDQDGMIGQSDGYEGMPWHLPNDLKHFSKITKQGDIVMGRTTYELMTNAPLADRRNIVLTSQTDYEAEGALVMHSIDQALDFYRKSDLPLFIIGGASVFQQFLPYADTIYRTVIHQSFEGDTYMVDIDWSQWELVGSRQGDLDEHNTLAHTFEKYQRISQDNG